MEVKKTSDRPLLLTIAVSLIAIQFVLVYPIIIALNLI